MTLHTRTLTIIGTTLFSLVILFYLFTNNFLLSNFAKLEEYFSRQYIERVAAIVESDLSAMSTVADDWASWDDTYAFIQDGNEEYVESNLRNETLIGLSLNLMVYVDTSGDIVISKAFDLESGQEASIAPDFEIHLTSGSLLLSHPDTASSISGIILYQDVPMLVVSEPILTSKAQGPIRGSLIFGRYLNEVENARLTDRVGASVSIQYAGDSSLPDDFQLAKAAISTETPVFTLALDEQNIASYVLLSDIEGNPLLIFRADMERNIYQQGRESTTYILLLILGVSIIVGILALLYIERTVLSRVAFLGSSVSAIGSSGKFSKRVSITGNDELSHLADDINEMLAALQRAQMELQVANRELIKRTEQLEEASQAKSNFLAQMSHELRTPLNAILGFSELLLDNIPGQMNKEQRECLDDIHGGGRYLLDLINDVLDLSKIESGKVELKLESLDLLVIMRDVVQNVSPLLINNSQSITIDIIDGPLYVYAEQRMLRQVLLNLLSNAIKFTPVKGEIGISAKCDEEDCQISISDNGIGIKAEFNERIFEAFIQVETLSKETKKGTGLGLRICQQYVESMGGRIWVQSEYGKGSIFTFTLPRKK
jgi:signal transduction histidine kinase